MPETRRLRRNDPLHDYVAQLYKGNGILPGCSYMGLDSAPLSGLAPFLNIREILAFAPFAWQMRSGEMLFPRGQNNDERGHARGLQDAFGDALHRNSLPDAFSLAFTRSGSILVKKTPFESLDAHLNPYSLRSLRQRLNAVGRDEYDEAVALLSAPAPEYLFLCDDTLVSHHPDADIRLMRFQTVYPRLGSTQERFLNEITRQLRSYSWDIGAPEMIATKNPLPYSRPPATSPSSQQLSLF